ncbi:glycosyl hydrolase 2 galactose-binding domain-containing protein [Novosphingobium sp.]|uniref:glycosyl hydrolase 2 galactose-binding domain-containing protein n=1 Tax=Novosphingobium sp. TaxID=1874826 RepID=UPI0038BCCC12
MSSRISGRLKADGMAASALALTVAMISPSTVAAQSAKAEAPAIPAGFGPYNAAFLAGGVGIDRDVVAPDLFAADASQTFSTWVAPSELSKGTVALISLGALGGPIRSLALVAGAPALITGADGQRLVAPKPLVAGQWTHLAAVLGPQGARIYVNGQLVAAQALPTPAVAAQIHIAAVIDGQPHFNGNLAAAQVTPGIIAPAAILAAAKARPDFALIQTWQVGVGWEWQKTANTGYWRQQDPWTLPQARGETTTPKAKPVVAQPALEGLSAGRWRINGWQLAAAPEVAQDGAQLSRPGKPGGTWRTATVPGTVLTTLIDRGVYPDPYFGLNNLKIPESLARQEYWYRTSFTLPPEARGKRLSIVLNGVNYTSEVFINGAHLGGTKGAFARGRFAFDAVAGENVIAIKVSPPPHPGIPHEQSISAGVGENGGQLAIDGPTFVATEGWDWIPGIRDRNTGLWQDVQLEANGAVRLGDPQVITDLPLPRTDSADITIAVPVVNDSGAAQSVTVTASFDDVRVSRTITAAPGETEVRFTPAEFAALHVGNPRLWWPNGYGDPVLHTLKLDASVAGQTADTATTRFGIREVSYDLSLMDKAGHLRRVNVQTTDGRRDGVKLIDVRHEAIKLSPKGWVESLTAAGESSTGVRDLGPEDTLPEPHLTLRVNGVKIAARGGSWGMDDALKRHERARLEPYFRLHMQANLNIIRNWMGNNSEPEFYDLADEYGMMVLNDFWQSTQNFQVEPQDPALFLANAADTVKRYRNHPSIVVWFGRNEGVPYPMLNEGLDDLLFRLDGTRWFTGSSNTVNLQGSGPYNYRQPEGYFTDLATGFSVETGTPSLATREAVAAYVPKADLWPLSDTLAYHDWHFSGNGDTKTFMASLARRFGEATSFDDFERKAQMINLEGHKAMFEGFLGHLWTRNSGRLLWMTHPSWTSNAWQIYSSDYDTHAAFYGIAKASEPIHVQLNLPGNEVVVVNTTRDPAPGLTATTRILGLDGKELFARADRLNSAANADTTLAAVPLADVLAKHPMVLVTQSLTDKAGRTISSNFYWRGRDEASYRALGDLAPVALTAKLDNPKAVGEEQELRVTLTNPATTPALAAKLTLLDAKGERILPAYYSDNYVSLLGGESQTVTIRYPARPGPAPHVALRGWNVVQAEARVP